MYIYISYIHICLGSRACPNDLVQRQPSERSITMKSQKGHSRWHVPSGLQSEGGTRGFVDADRSLKTFCFSFLERVITFNPPVTVLSFSLFSRRREGHKARATKSLNLTVGLLIHIYSTWRIWYKTIHHQKDAPHARKCFGPFLTPCAPRYRIASDLLDPCLYPRSDPQ